MVALLSVVVPPPGRSTGKSFAGFNSSTLFTASCIAKGRNLTFLAHHKASQFATVPPAVKWPRARSRSKPTISQRSFPASTSYADLKKKQKKTKKTHLFSNSPLEFYIETKLIIDRPYLLNTTNSLIIVSSVLNYSQDRSQSFFPFRPRSYNKSVYQMFSMSNVRISVLTSFIHGSQQSNTLINTDAQLISFLRGKL